MTTRWGADSPVLDAIDDWLGYRALGVWLVLAAGLLLAWSRAWWLARLSEVW